MAFSPEGNHVAFLGSRGGIDQLYVRALDSLEAKPIPGSEGAFCTPIFSPDGQWLAFYANGELKKVSLSGGPPVTLAKFPGPHGVSWGPDDTIIFADPSRGALRKVSAAGGTPQSITTVDPSKGETGHKWPAHLPGGKALLFAVLKGGSPDDAQIVVQRLDTGERKVLVEGGTFPKYVPTGHLVYLRAGTMMAVPFDAERLEVVGLPMAVTEEVRQSGQGAAQFALSSLGSLVYVPGGEQDNENTLVWVDRKGEEQPLAGFPSGFYQDPHLSLNGRRVVVMTGGGTNPDLWIYGILRATLTRLTFDEQSLAPIWSPDGRWIAYSSPTPGGAFNIFRRLADGSGAEERLTQSENPRIASSWSPDGKLIAFTELDPSAGDDIWLLPLEEDRKPQPFLQTPFREGQAVFSPDSRWLAYVSNESGRLDVYARPVSGSGEKWQISTEGGSDHMWARNGELFYRNGDKMMAVQITMRPTFSASSPQMLFERQSIPFLGRNDYDVTADGQRFLMLKSQQPPPSQFNVVLNWFEELKRLVPTDK